MRSLLLSLLIIALGSALADAQSDNTKQLLAARSGVTEISSTIVASHTNEMIKDSRYRALQQTAQDRLLHLELAQAKGTLDADGTQAFLVPVLDKNGQETGFFANRGDMWLLSLVMTSKDKTVVEGFTAKITSDDKVVVEAIPQTRSEGTRTPAEFTLHDNLTIGPIASSSQSSCQYVSSYSVSLGCFALPDNPFGYYYVQVTRFGTTPNPMSPQWWACYQGSIHVCPEFENSGSPLTIPVCGFPPSHPIG